MDGKIRALTESALYFPRYWSKLTVTTVKCLKLFVNGILPLVHPEKRYFPILHQTVASL